MSWTEWAPAATLAAGLGGAIVGASAVTWAARFNARRDGRWESVKTDLEVAELLDDDDEMKAWLQDYARVRLAAYAASETRTRPTIPAGLITFFVELVMMAAAITFAIFLPRAWPPEGESEVNTGVFTVIACVFIVVAFSYHIIRSIRRSARFGLRGVAREEQIATGTAIGLLHDRAKRMRDGRVSLDV